MKEVKKMGEIQEFRSDSMNCDKDSLYICAGGFEPRAKGIVHDLKRMNKKVFKYCNILEYCSSLLSKQNTKSNKFLDKNKENLEYLQDSLEQLSTTILPNTVIDIDNTLVSQNNLRRTLQDIPNDKIDSVFLDISGMANFLILLVFHQVEKTFYDKKIYVLYTEAKNYYPEEKEAPEILKLIANPDDDDILELGNKLGASGARETMLLPDFAGDFREDLPTCLIFFVGYEPSRAIGLLETYRPNLVIACYGLSPHDQFRWRAEFSKKLHKEFGVFDRYSLMETEISTFYIYPQPSSGLEIIPKLEALYTSQYEGQILYENHNVAITPQCSKLQTIASYEFCRVHPDVQIVFCLPGTFIPERYSEGIGRRWILYDVLQNRQCV